MNYDIEEFCCPTCLAVNAIDAMFGISELKDGDYTSIAIICKEDLTEKLLKIFAGIEINGFEFNIDFIEYDKADYEKEYAVIIDTNGTLSVCKAYLDGEYVVFGEDYIFVSDKCNCHVFIEQCDYDEDAVQAFCIKKDE